MAGAHVRHLEVLREVQPKDFERDRDVQARVGIGDQVHYQIRFPDGLLEERVVLADVELSELELAALDLIELLVGDIHGNDLMLPTAHQMLDQVRADKTAGAQNRDSHV